MASKVSLNEFTDNLAGMKNFKAKFTSDNTETRKRMVQIIEKVANGELTGRQKECLFMYYEKGMKMVEISDALGICISCVSRHIKKARIRIQRTLAYYYTVK